MPNTSSAKKALRQDRARTARNLQRKTRLKRALKTVSKDNLSSTVSLVDKAVKQQLIHKNKAARIKARLSKSVAGTSTKRSTAGEKSKPAKNK